MFPRLKMLIFGAVVVMIATVIGVIDYQRHAINKLRSENEQLYTSLRQEASANLICQSTVTALLKARSQSQINCEQRLAEKNSIIDQFEIIDNATREVNYVQPEISKVDSSVHRNSLITLLNGMLPEVRSTSSDTNPIRVSGSAAVAAGTTVLPGELEYCVGEVDAKNLLKNVVLLRAWANDMRLIFVSLSTGTK